MRVRAAQEHLQQGKQNHSVKSKLRILAQNHVTTSPVSCEIIKTAPLLQEVWWVTTMATTTTTGTRLHDAAQLSGRRGPKL